MVLVEKRRFKEMLRQIEVSYSNTNMGVER